MAKQKIKSSPTNNDLNGFSSFVDKTQINSNLNYGAVAWVISLFCTTVRACNYLELLSLLAVLVARLKHN